LLGRTNPDEGTTSLVLDVQRLGSDQDAGTGETTLRQLSLATGSADTPLGPAELAFLPPDRLLVSWIEPGAAESETHVERYRICYGE
jgi:hypothetical protein